MYIEWTGHWSILSFKFEISETLESNIIFVLKHWDFFLFWSYNFLNFRSFCCFFVFDLLVLIVWMFVYNFSNFRNVVVSWITFSCCMDASCRRTWRWRRWCRTSSCSRRSSWIWKKSSWKHSSLWIHKISEYRTRMP